MAKQCDVHGHINELVSPGDCTDLCSTIDQEIGSFVKDHFNDPFNKNFRANPDRWAKGEVPAAERRRLFTVWVGDAVDALIGGISFAELSEEQESALILRESKRPVLGSRVMTPTKVQISMKSIMIKTCPLLI